MAEKIELPRVRCSALPRVMSCTASSEKPDILIDTSGSVATAGTAAHEFYARMVMEGLDEPEGLFDLAEKHGVDEDELQMLAWSGLREWRKIRDRLDVLGVEWEGQRVVADTFRLTGHADVLARVKDDPATAVVIDWKTGYKDSDYLPQAKGYALLDLLINGNPNHPQYKEKEFVLTERYLLVVVWPRLRATDVFEFTAVDIIAFQADLRNIFKVETKGYAPSDSNCQYCPLTGNCPARRALIESAGHDIQAMTGKGSSGEITTARLASFYERSRLLKKALENYESMLKAAIIQEGGEVQFEGGEISLSETTYRKIDWNPEVLSQFLTSDQISELRPTLGKTVMDKAVSDNAPKGKKGVMKEACLLALKEAGSVAEKKGKSIKYRKVS